MSVFAYKARDQQGKAQFGELLADSLQDASEKLFQLGLSPIKIEQQNQKNLLKTFSLKRNPSIKESANITRQFEVMFSAGMQIDRSLAILSQQSEHPGLKEALKTIRDDVSSGQKLSDAFKKHPKYFSPLYTNMIELGQSGGILGSTLKELSRILQKEYYLQSKLKSALLYPKIVCGVLFMVIWAMLAFVFPQFKTFYSGFGADLPFPTLIMLGMSTIATTYWYLPAGFMAISYLLFKKYKSSKSGKLLLDRLSYRIPVFGHLNKLVANSRFGHLISALYRAGVSLHQSLLVVRGTIDNECFKEEVEKLRKGLEEGQSLSNVIRQSFYFSPMIKEACTIGEQTGKMDEILESTAKFFDEEVEDLVSNLTTLIEPVLIFFLFGAVLLLALAVYLPMWNMSKVVL